MVYIHANIETLTTEIALLYVHMDKYFTTVMS